MDVSEVLDQKETLKKWIYDRIEQFENETGVAVMDVTIERISISIVGKYNETRQSTALRGVEIETQI